MLLLGFGFLCGCCCHNIRYDKLAGKATTNKQTKKEGRERNGGTNQTGSTSDVACVFSFFLITGYRVSVVFHRQNISHLLSICFHVRLLTVCRR